MVVYGLRAGCRVWLVVGGDEGVGVRFRLWRILDIIFGE